jgi:ABC-2 type transport system ATP-binding protein
MMYYTKTIGMINFKNLTFSYRRKQVLHDVNLDIRQGLIYGLLGKNGEGKTTLLHIVSGLLYPDKGECTVLGHTPSSRKASFLQQIFLLPEEIYFPDVSAGQYFSIFKPFYPSFSDEILKSCVETFEVETQAPLRKMSLGQKKKAAIALALAANTPLLLMDEPTNGLDIPSKSVFRRLLSQFFGDERAVVISTHQVRDLESLIDAVIILDNKEILFNNTLNEIGGKLAFGPVDANERSFYTETSPTGNIGVTVNRSGENSPVSLELLFNAAVSAKNEIKQLLNS